MTASRSWIPAALLAGLAYVIVGRLFAWPTTHVQIWRLAAWVVSGVVFAAHIGYERSAAGNSTLLVAGHSAAAAAIGGFGLAVAGVLHAVTTTGGLRAVWYLALVAWPLIVAVPAFLLALAIGAVLDRVAAAQPK